MSHTDTPEIPYATAMSRVRRDAIEREMLSLYREKIREEDEKAFMRKGRHTQYYNLLEQTAKAAEAYAIANNQSPDDFASDLLNDALNVCDDIRRALDQSVFGNDAPFIVWRHVGQVRSFKKHEDFPGIDRETLYQATGQYLRLPVRIPIIDRILTDALVASETLSYAVDTFIKSKSQYFPSRSPLFQPHILRSFFVGVFWNLAVCCGPAALVFYLGTNGTIGAGWALGITLGLIALFLVFIAIQIVALPFAWKQQIATRKKVAELMLGMLTTYDELRDDGPVSANRVYDLAVEAAKTGVSWPPPLFALLDDVKLRGAHL